MAGRAARGDEVVGRYEDRRVRDDRLVAGGREYAVDLPSEKRPGELREGRRSVASLTIRHPEHGSVLLAEVPEPCDELALAFAACVAYLRKAERRTRRGGELVKPAGGVTATAAFAAFAFSGGGFANGWGGPDGGGFGDGGGFDGGGGGGGGA